MDRSKPRNVMQVKPLLMTFMFSALFHGFYAGYYLIFAGGFLYELSYKVFGNTALVAPISKKLPNAGALISCVYV